MTYSSRLLRPFLAGGLFAALILGCLPLSCSNLFGAAPKAAKNAAESVELFQGMQDGKIDAKIVFKNRKAATVSIENKTDKPLNVILPEVVGAVPVLAQIGGGGNGNNDGGLQSMMDNLGQGGGGGGGGGGAFMLPPEKVIRRDVVSVCLDHGKKDPTPKTEYQLKPIEQVTDRPAVIELGSLMGKKGVADHETIQMATWMLNNDLTTDDLAKETWKSATGRISPAHTPAQLQAAANLAQYATQTAQNKAGYKAPTTDSSDSQNQ